MDDIPLSAQLSTLAVLLVLSGFFSMAETSMMSVNRYRLKALVRLGNRGALIAAELLAHTDRLLGVILLGNNLVNAASAVLAGVITVRVFGENEFALGIGTLAATFLILVFSEITPKVIGAAYAERIALPIAYVLKPLLKALYPVVWFVNLFVGALLFMTRLKTRAGDQPQRMSMEELRSVVLESANFMPKKHQSILVNLFDLERITVEDVMTPRSQIETIDLEAPIEDIVRQLATSYHTRLLVYRGELGNIAGILHLRRVLRLVQADELDAERLAGLLIAPYYIPASTPLFAQLQYFQENHQRFALVVDEYGELLGLVTVEDIIEELIGEFTSTAPARANRLAWDKDGACQVEGSSPVRELNRKLDLALPMDGPKTLNGLVLEHLQDIPEAGVSLRIAGVRMEIVQTLDRVVKTVRLFRPAVADLQ